MKTTGFLLQVSPLPWVQDVTLHWSRGRGRNLQRPSIRICIANWCVKGGRLDEDRSIWYHRLIGFIISSSVSLLSGTLVPLFLCSGACIISRKLLFIKAYLEATLNRKGKRNVSVANRPQRLGFCFPALPSATDPRRQVSDRGGFSSPMQQQQDLVPFVPVTDMAWSSDHLGHVAHDQTFSSGEEIDKKKKR